MTVRRISHGIPSKARTDGDAMNQLTSRMRTFKKVRMLGAAALMLSWVACGRADAYAEDDIMFWDVAAGLALVKAAEGGPSANLEAASGSTMLKAESSCAIFLEMPIEHGEMPIKLLAFILKQ
jgi:fructose-1,6-bisphosphatase/inositol monophosphatase family enzyme